MQLFCNAAVNVTSDAAGTLIYEAPVNQEVVIHNLYISNNSETDQAKLEVKLVKAGATFTTAATETPGSFYVVSKYLPIDPLNTIELKPINLMAGDKLMIRKLNIFNNLSGTIVNSQLSGQITISDTVTTLTGLASTASLLVNDTVTRITGSGSFGTNAKITAINAPSKQITITADTANVAGDIYFNIGRSISDRVTIITGISSTSILRTGLTISKVSGTGILGSIPTISKINSDTQITITSATVNTEGSIVFSIADAPEIHVVASILKEIKDF